MTLSSADTINVHKMVHTPGYIFRSLCALVNRKPGPATPGDIPGLYGAVSGSKIQVCLFDMMLRHHDTSLRPLTLTLRRTYTTSCLDDITFRQHDLSLRRDDITFREHRLLLCRVTLRFACTIKRLGNTF